MNGNLPTRVGDLLVSVTERTGIRAPIETARLWSRWREIVGDEIASHAEPTSLRDGVLRIRADSSVWATEIGYLGEEICKRANALAGTAIVAEVRVWTGRGMPSTRPTKEPVPERAERRVGAPDDDDDADPLTVLQRARAAWARRRAGTPPSPS